jgi:hypothetical protein
MKYKITMFSGRKYKTKSELSPPKFLRYIDNIKWLSITSRKHIPVSKIELVEVINE